MMAFSFRNFTNLLNKSKHRKLRNRKLRSMKGASVADVYQRTGFGEPGKGTPQGDESTCFASHA
jgi:hypothetical protein